MIVCGIYERKLPELLCAVSCTTVVHNEQHTRLLKLGVGLGRGLVFAHLFRFSILCVCFFWFSLQTGWEGPVSTLEPLQRVQNAAARLVFGLGRFEHVTPSLIQLHWLPVSYRIKFKLCCFIHAIHYGRSPTYLTQTVQSVSASRQRSGLRSSSTSVMDYSLPRLRTKFGKRAFSHAGPST